jgi:hypothetical protein
VENCIVTVHLAVRDSDLYIPDASWDRDRERCAAAHVPESVAHRSKWVMALEQVKRAVANGVRFDWLTCDPFDVAQGAGYGGKPEFLALLDGMGQHYCCEVPANLMCWPTYPTYDSHQRPYQAKRADNAAVWGKPFRKQPWQRVELARQTLGPQQWEVKAGQVHLQRDGQPTDRTYWLIVARNVDTGEVKHFVSNAPPPHAAADVAEGGVQPVGRRARVPAGQERGRLRPLRGPQLARPAQTHDPVPGRPAVRRRADRSAVGGTRR